MMSEKLPGDSTPPRLGEFSRIAGVFFEPAKAFEDIAARPRFVVPLVLVTLMTFGYMLAFSQRVGWERMIRQRIEQSPRAAQLSEEQKEQQIAMSARFVSIGGYVGALVVPSTFLLESAILLGIVAGILGAPVKFRQVFAVICYSALVALISLPLSIAVMFLKDPDDFNMQNPLLFNPGAFMDPLSSSRFLYSLASSIDLFSFWTIFLIATGLKAAGGKKLSFASALTAVIVPWGIYVLGKSVLAIFG
jgi:Yip1-like protein